MNAFKKYLIILIGFLSLASFSAKANFTVDVPKLPSNLTIVSGHYCDGCENFDEIFGSTANITIMLKWKTLLPGCKVSVVNESWIYSTTSYSKDQCSSLLATLSGASAKSPGYITLDPRTGQIVKISRANNN